MEEHGNNNTNKVGKRKWKGLTYPLKVEKWSSKKKMQKFSLIVAEIWRVILNVGY